MVNVAAFSAIVTYIAGGRLSSWDKAETTRDAHDHPGIPPRLRVIEGGKDLAPGARKSAGKLERIT